MTRSLNILTIIIRLFIYSLPLLLFLWLWQKDLVQGGQLVLTYNFDEPISFISPLEPKARASKVLYEDGNAYQIIQDEPVYVDVRLPRRFDTAKVKLHYQNLDQAIFELGALADAKNWLFDLRPVYNEALNNLFFDKLRWDPIYEGDVVLFRKDQRFKTVDEFTNQLPPLNQIASYRYDLESSLILPGYEPTPGGITINKSLRGSHRMFTYIKNEPLELNLLIQDVNRNAGDDFLDIAVYKNNREIFSQFIQDDGVVDDRAEFSEPQEINISIPGLAEGVYRIELQTRSDDIFIRRLQTSQDLLVFLGSVYLADNVGFSDDFIDQRLEPTRLYTNGSRFKGFTSHIEGLQTLLVGDEFMTLNQTHKDFFVTTDFGNKNLVVGLNDVKVSTSNGFFAFSPSQFFVPQEINLNDGQPFDTDLIDYVIARYRPPQSSGAWLESQVVFELDKLSTADNELHLIFSLPGLAEGSQGIKLNTVEVTLNAQPLNWAGVADDFLLKLKQFL